MFGLALPISPRGRLGAADLIDDRHDQDQFRIKPDACGAVTSQRISMAPPSGNAALLANIIYN